MELKDKIRAVREAVGLNNKEFGEVLDCSGSWIGEIEKGTKEPSKTLFRRIARISQFPRSPSNDLSDIHCRLT